MSQPMCSLCSSAPGPGNELFFPPSQSIMTLKKNQSCLRIFKWPEKWWKSNTYFKLKKINLNWLKLQNDIKLDEIKKPLSDLTSEALKCAFREAFTKILSYSCHLSIKSAFLQTLKFQIKNLFQWYCSDRSIINIVTFFNDFKNIFSHHIPWVLYGPIYTQQSISYSGCYPSN